MMFMSRLIAITLMISALPMGNVMAAECTKAQRDRGRVVIEERTAIWRSVSGRGFTDTHRAINSSLKELSERMLVLIDRGDGPGFRTEVKKFIEKLHEGDRYLGGGFISGLVNIPPFNGVEGQIAKPIIDALTTDRYDTKIIGQFLENRSDFWDYFFHRNRLQNKVVSFLTAANDSGNSSSVCAVFQEIFMLD